MRNIEYLSPSSITVFWKDRREYYLRYLCEQRPPKIPQNHHMAAGSAFDAHVKAYLHEAIFGKGKDPRFDLVTLFNAQVEPQNRDDSFSVGKYVFQQYQKSGSLANLMLELQSSITDPRFELEVKGVLGNYREGVQSQFGDVVLLGKPDLFFINKSGAHVIFDWKVNGFYSKSGVSPMKGYVRLMENGSNLGSHKESFPILKDGVLVNKAARLETLNTEWANQLSIYCWLCGEEVGAETFCAIDQICCRPSFDMPSIRVAEHRAWVSTAYQKQWFETVRKTWDIIKSGHIFTDLTREQSDERCKLLDEAAKTLRSDLSEDQWFNEITRQDRPW
jgi:hypothetical protein